MSKLTKAYLTQGNNKYENIVAVDLTIKKAWSMPKPKGCDEWEIFLDMDNISNLVTVWKKNPKFKLYIEYTAKENGKLLVETICGEIDIENIISGSALNGPHSVRAHSKALKMSSKDKFVREKVQFT